MSWLHARGHLHAFSDEAGQPFACEEVRVSRFKAISKVQNGKKNASEHRCLSCLETSQRPIAVGFSICVLLRQLEFDVMGFNVGGSSTGHITKRIHKNNSAVYGHDKALLHHVAHIGHACASRSWRYSRQLEQAAAAECLDPGDTPTSCLTQRKSRRICQRLGTCLAHAGLVQKNQRRESKRMQ